MDSISLRLPSGSLPTLRSSRADSKYPYLSYICSMIELREAPVRTMLSITKRAETMPSFSGMWVTRLMPPLSSPPTTTFLSLRRVPMYLKPTGTSMTL